MERLMEELEMNWSEEEEKRSSMERSSMEEEEMNWGEEGTMNCSVPPEKFHEKFHQRQKRSSMEEEEMNWSEEEEMNSSEEEEMNWCEEHKLRMMTSVPPKNAKCGACTRTFSESGEAVYYNCTDCDVVIHRKCAEVPKQIDHPMHPEHPLLLLARPPYESKTCECQVCQKSWRNFVYHCSSCEFDIDILCVILEDEDIKIPTHHHPMRLIPRPAEFKCNACGVRGEENDSYMCTKPSCWFWVHKKCGSLPEMFQRPDHDHRLLLATSVPDQYRKYKLTCEICFEDLKPKFWVYYCKRCKYFIHIKCTTNRVRGRGWGHTYSGGDPPIFQTIRELKTVMKDNLLYENVHGNGLFKFLMQRDPPLPEVKVDSHKHSLILDSDCNQDGDEIICDGCIEHITSPYYKCGQCCNYFLHTTCAALPKHCELHQDYGAFHYSGDLRLELHFAENPWEVVKCKACNSFCNGYTYKCTKDGDTFYLDIKCCYFLALYRLEHIGHKHVSVPLLNPYSTLMCSACGGCSSFFRCDLCNFRLGFECVVLPATVKHRWDKHPLILSFPPHIRDTDEGEEFYCEVCEEEIHPKRWMYRCAECDHSFHARCIPTLGESRNIKFGKTVSIQSHPHHLTLVPQAKLTSRCHTCRKSLHWSRGFECAPCGFYLCPDCLPKEELVVG